MALTFACAEYAANLRIVLVVSYGHQEIRLTQTFEKKNEKESGRENVKGKVYVSRKSCHRIAYTFPHRRYQKAFPTIE